MSGTKITGDPDWALDADGHLINADAWTQGFAQAIADQEGWVLNQDHWWLIDFVRDYFQTYGNPPLMRTVIGAYRTHKDDPSLGSASLYQLFSEHPIRQACRLGGLPKPDWCI